MNETNANVLEEINVEDVIDVCEELTESNNGVIALVVSGAAIAVAAVVGVAYKNRAKIKDWKAKRKAKKAEKSATSDDSQVEEDASREDETK
jgi:hypothetical protein